MREFNNERRPRRNHADRPTHRPPGRPPGRPRPASRPRNYKQEANNLKGSAGILAVFCIIIILSVGAIFLHIYLRGRETVAVGGSARNTPLLHAVELYNSREADKPPFIPLNWNEGIFFDALTGQLIFPRGLAGAEISTSDDFTLHTATFAGLELDSGTTHLMQYDTAASYVYAANGQVHVRTRRGKFFERGQSDDYAYIRIVDPRERYHTIIVLDAGHGGRDDGAPNVNGSGPHEAENVLYITLETLRVFEPPPGVLVIPTRLDNDFDILRPQDRVRIASAIGDYFISVHNNACGISRDSAGTLTMYGIADGSYEIAGLFQDAMVLALGTRDRGLTHDPDVAILRDTTIPTVLLELMFISNPAEATRLADPTTRRQIANVIAQIMGELPPARQRIGHPS